MTTATKKETLSVPPEAAGARIDKFLADALAHLTRSRLKKLFEEGYVLLNGAVAKPSAKVKDADSLSVEIPETTPMSATPEDIHLDVVYEDADIIIINKPAGMVVHPAVGHFTGTLVHALLGHCGASLSGVGGVERPGIVHRIDKDTTGLIAVAKNDEAHLALTRQLAERTLSRTYIAVVKGSPKQPEGAVDANIGRHPKDRKKMAALKTGGRMAVTKYKTLQTLQKLQKASVLEVTLVTGRTHQIRVHMAHINCPVIGDPDYSREGKYPIRRQALHAWKMKLTHPRTGEAMEFTSPIPKDMVELIKSLGGDPAPYL
jgi:23S rRNA pseudouridine1911/1915/1917 synthase